MAKDQKYSPEYHAAYRAANREKILEYQRVSRAANKLKNAEYQKAYRAKTAETRKAYGLAYYQANREDLMAKDKLRRQAMCPLEVKAKRAVAYKRDRVKRLAKSWPYLKRRRETDPVFKAEVLLRDAIRKALKRGGAGKNTKATSYLGCAIPEALAHIKALFQPGMTWENWAADGWHLDHVRPVASFDKTDPNWVFAANHYTNLQPLWAVDNLVKGAKWVA